MTLNVPRTGIDESELQFQFIRASGPGGQNVNKVATSVQLRFDVSNSRTFSQEIKERLGQIAKKQINQEGILIIEAKRFRTQEKNRADAIARLNSLILKALEEPKVRKKTKPGVTASAARVVDKKRRGEMKRSRHYNPEEWE